MIKFFDYTRSYEDIRSNIIKNIEAVIDSGKFINGPQVGVFEQYLQNYLKANHSLGVSSGTDALLVAILASVKKKSGYFIVPSFTFTATAMAPLRLGYDIRFVDVKEGSFSPSIQDIINNCCKDTVGVIWPYLFGEPADLYTLYDFCKKNDIVLIEDCAQSLGTSVNKSKVGTHSDVGCFSFFPTKNLGCFGDGGAIVTNSEKIIKDAKKIKSHGYYSEKYNSSCIGGNFRLDTIHATVMLEIFKKFDLLLMQRKDSAYYYDCHISNNLVKKPNFVLGHSWNQYTVVVDCNKKFKEYMKNKNIQTCIYYPTPLHKNTVFDIGTTLKHTEELCKKVISLPVYPGLSADHKKKIVEAVNDYRG